MYWTNPGDELSEKYHRIKSFYQDKEIIIYGAGMMGGRIDDAIKALTSMNVREFWDRNPQKREYKGKQVRHLEEIAVTQYDVDHVLLVIGLPDEIGRGVRDNLVARFGIKQCYCKLYTEFVMHDFPIIALYEYDKVFLDSISMIITEHCTLKCEKCAIMLPFFKETSQYPKEKLMQEADALFDKVDFIGNYTVTGGEPLLNRALPELLAYIGENYRDKIGSYKIITNGTIEPSAELIEIMQKYHVAAEISDYTNGVPQLKEKIESVVETYRKNNIQTYFLSAARWVDFGFEDVQNNYTIEQARAFFDYCHTRCRGYVDGKIRYCINAFFAERTLYGTEDINNMLDVVNMENTEKSRRKLVEFDLGYNEKGFLLMCQHCNGTVEINQNFIEVGKQCQNH